MTEGKASNIVWHMGRVDRKRRQEIFGQQGATLWFTGLSGAGKSTLAFALENRLIAAGFKSYVLDGDNIRHGLNNNLGFSAVDREENVRRVGEVSRLFADAGMIVLSSFISPFRKDRRIVRDSHQQAGLRFIEVFIDTPLEVCEQRDPKKLYEKARRGEIADFTGISSPYEIPENPEIIINPSSTPDEDCERIIAYLLDQDIIRRRD